MKNIILLFAILAIACQNTKSNQELLIGTWGAYKMKNPGEWITVFTFHKDMTGSINNIPISYQWMNDGNTVVFQDFEKQHTQEYLQIKRITPDSLYGAIKDEDLIFYKIQK